MRRSLAAALTAAMVLSLVGCSTSSSGSDAATTADSTTTTRQVVHGSLVGPTTGRTLTPADPLRVTLFGDSVLYDAEPAVTANLTSTGVVRPANRTTPGFNFGHGLSLIAADLDWRSLVGDMMAETKPEVVVTWFGIIDSFGISRSNQTPEGFTAALREALSMMTSGSTKVIMFGVPPSMDKSGTSAAAPMNRDANPIMERLSAEFAGKVEYFDTDRLLSPSDSAVYTLDGVRVRKLDLIHICPDGAALIAEAIHATLARSWPVPPATVEWRTGPWRSVARYDDPPGACVDTYPGLGG